MDNQAKLAILSKQNRGRRQRKQITRQKNKKDKTMCNRNPTKNRGESTEKVKKNALSFEVWIFSSSQPDLYDY